MPYDFLLLILPALLGLAALVGGVALLNRPRTDDGRRSPWVVAAALVLLAFACAVGGCYALVFGSSMFH